MAGLKLVASSGAQALAADTAETVLQLSAAANHRIVIQGFSVTLSGTAAKDLIVRLVRQTGTGTAGTLSSTTQIIYPLDSSAAETIQTLARTNYSAEPGLDTPNKVVQYKRLQSSYEKVFALGQEIVVPGGGFLGIEVTSVGATATVAAEFFFEE